MQRKFAEVRNQSLPPRQIFRAGDQDCLHVFSRDGRSLLFGETASTFHFVAADGVSPRVPAKSERGLHVSIFPLAGQVVAMFLRFLLLSIGLVWSLTLCGDRLWGQQPEPTVELLPSGETSEAAESEEPEESEEDELETDRDSFTPATGIVAQGRTIVEAAYTFIDNRRVKETHSYPELLMRYGLTETIELRLGWNKEVGGAGSPVSGNVPSDFEDEAGELEEEARILYGAKIFLTEQRGWVPQSSWIVQGYTPTYALANHSDFSTAYVFGWRNEAGWQLNFATRYGTGRAEEDEFNTWAPSSVLKIPVGDRANVHAEYFGVFTQGRAEETTQHFFSSGAHYLVTRNLELGTRVGWGLNEQSPNFFTNVGVGWRF